MIATVALPGRGRFVREVVGQPGDAFDVEVVGRLVEEEQLGVGDEQSGEGEAAALATGLRADAAVEAADVLRLDAAEQAGQDVTDAGVAGPDVLGQVAEHGLTDRPLGVERVLLGEHADADAVGAALLRDAARVGILQAGHDAQQRRLAAAVDADDADAVAREDAEADVVEHVGGAEDEGDPFEGDEVGHR